MNSCEEMVNYFYSTISYWLDYYMPLVTTSVDSRNKPWVTRTFQSLIKQRQRAFMASQTILYRKLQNRNIKQEQLRPYIQLTLAHGGERQNSF